MNKKPALLFEEWLMIGILAIQVSLVCACVLSRYAFNGSISFTEELTRYLLIWLTGLGFSASYARNEMMGFRWPGHRPEWLNKALQWLGIAAGALFSILLLISSMQMIQLQWRYRQLTSVMEWPIVLISAAFPVASILYLVRTILRLRSSNKMGGIGVFFIVILLLPIASSFSGSPFDSPWIRHTIDNTSQGADGVRLADANRDGLPDIATGWEEGGLIRVYLHPGPSHVKSPWPSVTVGQVGSPEDAVFADLDSDGALDVISCSESDTRQVWIHWAPANPDEFLHSNSWNTESIPACRDKAQWMYCLPMQIDGKNGIDLVLGAKNKNARIGWLESPPNPRNAADWQWHSLSEAGWIMSIEETDLNQDGHPDILVSDRKGHTRGCYWLENPRKQPTASWNRHPISDNNQEFMFLDSADIDRDGSIDIPVAIRSSFLSIYWAQPSSSWKQEIVSFPTHTGTGKSVAIGDIDLDRTPDIVVSCENAFEDRAGVFWMQQRDSQWISHPVSGPEGVKFDRVELLDLDGDGDLDILTCEESDNLGVIWYENPC